MDRVPSWPRAEPRRSEQQHLGGVEHVVGLFLTTGYVHALQVLRLDLHQHHVVQGAEVGLAQVDQATVLVEEQCETVTLENDLSKHHLAGVVGLDLINFACRQR